MAGYRVLDDGGDHEYVVKWRQNNAPWDKGYVVKASSATRAEQVVKRYVSYTKGLHMSNLDCRAKRLDQKSVWPGGIDGGLVR